MPNDTPPRDMPFNRLLGITLKARHADGVTIACRVRDDLRNAGGMLHGGVTATLVDVAVGMAAWHHLGEERPIATVELKLNYFLPIEKGRITARARLLRKGTSLIVGSVEVKDAIKNLVAFGTATYKILG